VEDVSASQYGDPLQLARGEIYVPANVELEALRRPRADAERNRVRVLEAAKLAFAEKGAAASLDEIARRAGVGIGTLYRNYPTRDALIKAVYQQACEQLVDKADHLLTSAPPVAALRAWMLECVEYLATKHGLSEALNSIVGGTSGLQASSGVDIRAAMTRLVDRAIASGDIQLDIDPIDLLRAVAGVVIVNAAPDWKHAAMRLVDILIDGIRCRPSAAG
jgi:AcrR family transcriptional regulator